MQVITSAPGHSSVIGSLAAGCWGWELGPRIARGAGYGQVEPRAGGGEKWWGEKGG